MSIVQFINPEERLQFIMVGDQKDHLLVADATSIIERHLWLQGTENMVNIDSSDGVREDTVQNTQHTHIFFFMFNNSRK